MTVTSGQNLLDPMLRWGHKGKQAMNSKTLQILGTLACPKSGEPLQLVESLSLLYAAGAGLAYPIVDGVPTLLPEAAIVLDEATRSRCETLARKKKAPPLVKSGAL